MGKLKGWRVVHDKNPYDTDMRWINERRGIKLSVDLKTQPFFGWYLEVWKKPYGKENRKIVSMERSKKEALKSARLYMKLNP